MSQVVSRRPKMEVSSTDDFRLYDLRLRCTMKLGRWPLAVACIGLGLFGGLVATQQLNGQPQPLASAPALPGREWQSFSPVVKRVLPGVVCIEGKGRAKRPAGEDTDPGFGSGVLISPTGDILTNNHVVADLDQVEV